jgi:hypothetical protein
MSIVTAAAARLKSYGTAQTIALQEAICHIPTSELAVGIIMVRYSSLLQVLSKLTILMMMQ